MEHKVFIVDDHAVIRNTLSKLINLEKGFRACGEAGNLPDALQGISENSPDIVIVDLNLGHDSGIRLIEILLRLYPGLPVMVLSMHDESLYAERCLKAGARGYIMKAEPPEKLISALNSVLSGKIYISDRLGKVLCRDLLPAV